MKRKSKVLAALLAVVALWSLSPWLAPRLGRGEGLTTLRGTPSPCWATPRIMILGDELIWSITEG